MIESIERKILKNSGNSLTEVVDRIAVEKRIVICINGKEVLSMFATPMMVRELVAGILATEPIIEGGWCADRMSIEYGDAVRVDVPAEGRVSLDGAVITSGCIGGVTFPKRMTITQTDDPFTISPARLKALFHRFQRASALYQATGCVHSAALSDGDDILCLAEDIGRHNAVDKIIGYGILEQVPFAGKIMLASGRLSSEIVAKCAKWHIPIVASRTSPTSLALEIAEKGGVTVVGFIRADRLNVYTNPQRIGPQD
ncbi:MAG TPA: formate dehydrogenase accessory sulfurtransferase FdhD [Dissulfurispiraceae bacterium]|nr:formate dehydrogenase accessory sulfurtransferase FdhD [Dissulfurispiraceae bacterium]